jgi:hypothetical protein
MLAASVRYGFVCYAQRSEDAETDDRSARQVTRYVSAFRRIAGQGKSLRFAVVSAPKTQPFFTRLVFSAFPRLVTAARSPAKKRQGPM